MFDYSYDSGDDWEEEEEGGEEILSDVDSEGEGMEDDDDDDGFLVPDDEVESISASRAASRSPSPSASHAPSRAKRKVVGGDGVRKRRQITSPLIPFSKGPCYENEIGRCDYEPFQAFQIQLLNGVLVLFIRVASRRFYNCINCRFPLRIRPILLRVDERRGISSVHHRPEATDDWRYFRTSAPVIRRR